MMGLVANITSGAAALRDAAVESFEGGDTHTHQQNRIDDNGDSDDEV
jgi:hypothetical protein